MVTSHRICNMYVCIYIYIFTVLNPYYFPTSWQHFGSEFVSTHKYNVTGFEHFSGDYEVTVKFKGSDPKPWQKWTWGTPISDTAKSRFTSPQKYRGQYHEFDDNWKNLFIWYDMLQELTSTSKILTSSTSLPRSLWYQISFESWIDLLPESHPQKRKQLGTSHNVLQAVQETCPGSSWGSWAIFICFRWFIDDIDGMIWYDMIWFIDDIDEDMIWYDL